MGFRQENPRRQWKWFPCFASVKDNHVETGDEEADTTETVKFSVAYSLGEAVCFLPFVEEEFWCLWLSQSALTVNLTQLKKKKKKKTKISQLSNWFYQVDLHTAVTDCLDCLNWWSRFQLAMCGDGAVPRNLSGLRHFVHSSSHWHTQILIFGAGVYNVAHGSHQGVRQSALNRPSFSYQPLPHRGSTSIQHLAVSENLSSSITWPLSKWHWKLAPRVFLRSRENK